MNQRLAVGRARASQAAHRKPRRRERAQRGVVRRQPARVVAADTRPARRDNGGWNAMKLGATKRGRGKRKLEVGGRSLDAVGDRVVERLDWEHERNADLRARQLDAVGSETERGDLASDKVVLRATRQRLAKVEAPRPRAALHEAHGGPTRDEPE